MSAVALQLSGHPSSDAATRVAFRSSFLARADSRLRRAAYLMLSSVPTAATFLLGRLEVKKTG